MTQLVVRRAGQPELRSAPGDLGEAQRQLEAADLIGSEQEQTRREMLAFCRHHADALVRSCLEGHLTASAVIVDPVAGRTLLIHHAKLRRWLQPGGHADGDGNLASVAWREANEETGLGDLAIVTPAIDLDVHRIPARADEPEHLHLDVRYVALLGRDRTPAHNHEALDARWFAPDARELAASEELQRLVRRGLDVARALAGPEGGGPERSSI